ncbi:MAG TPA: hypothetical protein VMI31_03840 [Fimbriimonadaceae bacterium]|nr:hypothetical protein [Fimbriimonadaceae bacterium]
MDDAIDALFKHADFIRIGVMGSAALVYEDKIAQKCRALGRAIAQNSFAILTGACPGLPHETVLGAKELGGHSIGISPARNLEEHQTVFESPYHEYDVMIYTGLGLMGRELVNIRTSDIIIIVGGRSGTLGEFAIAYEEGKVIGVLKGTGGVADSLAEFESILAKGTGAIVIHEEDPAELVKRVVEAYRSRTGMECPSPKAKIEPG